MFLFGKLTLPLGHGSGTVYYSDERIAVVVIAGDGIPPGLFTTFFKAKGKKLCLGSFDSLGKGSVMYPSGNVMLNSTAQGGSYYEENGEVKKLWTWDKFPLKWVPPPWPELQRPLTTPIPGLPPSHHVAPRVPL